MGVTSRSSGRRCAELLEVEMLDRFLEVAYEAEKQASNRQQLVDELKRLPVDELKKIASGESKIAYIGEDPCWPE